MGRRLLVSFVALLSILWAASWAHVQPDLAIAGSPEHILVCEHGEKHVPLDPTSCEQSALAQARLAKWRSAFQVASILFLSCPRNLDVASSLPVKIGSEA